MISIVIPAYNEASTVGEVVWRVRKAEPNAEVIVVNDGSTDGTATILGQLQKDYDLKVIRHERNMGKGAAIRSALSKVNGDVIIIQDADLEYDPKDYPKLLEPILDGRADVVYGSRFLGGPHRAIYFWHSIGNKLLTFFSNMMNNLNLTDMETGYKAFKRGVMDGIIIKSDRFGFEPELTAKLAKKGLRIYEVPISYSGRSYLEGKKVSWRDGLAAIWFIIRYRLWD